MTDHSLFELILFFILTVAAEILGTVGGFGSSMFFVSLLQLLVSFRMVLAMTGLLHIFSNTSKVILFWKSIDWKLTAWLGLSSIVMATVGAFLTPYINPGYAKIVLGIFLMVLSVVLLIKPDLKLVPSRETALAGGALSGFLAGFVGTGGAVRGLVLASFHLEKNLLVGTSAAIDFGVDLTRTMVYFKNGFFEKEIWFYVPIMLIASFLGTYIGKILLSRISQQLFKMIVLILVGAMGLLMVIHQ